MHLVPPWVAGPVVACRDGRAGTGDRRSEPVLELDDDSLCAFLADAGYPGECGEVLGCHRAPQFVRTQHGEHRLRQPRPDPACGLQQFERRSLVRVRETVERQ